MSVRSLVAVACLAAGCSAGPEALHVESWHPGTDWEVIAVEGPSKVQGTWREPAAETQLIHMVDAMVWQAEQALDE